MAEEKGVSLNLSSKFLEKLADHTAAFIGGVLEPRQLKRIAKANAEVALLEADTATQIKERDLVARIRLDDRELQLAERAKYRLGSTEMRRQRNIEAITYYAAEEHPESVSEEPVDPDWMASFFEGCQDIGDEHMRRLWGKLLAREVSQPGRFSRRTLTVLRTMDSIEAERFTEFCRYFLMTNQVPMHLSTKETDFLLLSRKVGTMWVEHLEAIGLIAPSPRHSSISFKTHDPLVYTFAGKQYAIHSGDTLTRHLFTIPVFVTRLSFSGLQLARLTNADDDAVYWAALEESLVKLGMRVEEIGPAPPIP